MFISWEKQNKTSFVFWKQILSYMVRFVNFSVFASFFLNNLQVFATIINHNQDLDYESFTEASPINPF